MHYGRSVIGKLQKWWSGDTDNSGEVTHLKQHTQIVFNPVPVYLAIPSSNIIAITNKLGLTWINRKEALVLTRVLGIDRGARREFMFVALSFTTTTLRRPKSSRCTSFANAKDKLKLVSIVHSRAFHAEYQFYEDIKHKNIKTNLS